MFLIEEPIYSVKLYQKTIQIHESKLKLCTYIYTSYMNKDRFSDQCVLKNSDDETIVIEWLSWCYSKISTANKINSTDFADHLRQILKRCVLLNYLQFQEEVSTIIYKDLLQQISFREWNITFDGYYFSNDINTHNELYIIFDTLNSCISEFPDLMKETIIDIYKTIFNIFTIGDIRLTIQRNSIKVYPSIELILEFFNLKDINVKLPEIYYDYYHFTYVFTLGSFLIINGTKLYEIVDNNTKYSNDWIIINISDFILKSYLNLLN